MYFSKSILTYLAILMLLISSGCSNQRPTRDDFGIHSKYQIEKVKKFIVQKKEPYYSAYYQLLSIADRAMDDKIAPKASLYIPPTYEDGEGHNKAAEYIMSNAYDSYVLALTWKINNNEKYAKKAIEILDSWADKNNTLSNNFDTPLVASYGGVGFIYAASLLSSYKKWNQNSFKKWVKNVYLPNVLIARERINNQGSWGNLAALASYAYLNNNKAFNKEVERTKYLINIQINSNGFLEKEIKREKDGMVYTYFSLAPLTQSMYLIYNETGENLFDLKYPEGKKIKMALDKFFVYVNNPREWPFYNKNDLNSPSMTAYHNWPGNLYEAMSKVYPNSNYDRLTEGYRPILGAYIKNKSKPSHLSWNFPTLMPPIFKNIN